MEVIFILLGCAAGGATGWFAGHRLGVIVSDRRPWRYWALNAVVVVLGFAGNMLGLASRQTWLWMASIAFLPAALTGLKYGRGKTVGPGSLEAPELEQVDIPPLWDED
ncbi:MAG: hypothetical protein LLG08_06130 [Actinomycetia bacterium]|nr:hypothetical protein [Actinomycetes bacterium]